MWNQEKDLKLRSLVFEQHQYDWETLASVLGVTTKEVIERWQSKIYCSMRSDKMVAGAFIWTKEQDQIIKNANLLSPQKWQNLLIFLPGRTYFSLEARWKRIHLKNPPIKLNQINFKVKSNLPFINHQRRLDQYRKILAMRNQSEHLSHFQIEEQAKQIQE